MSEDSGSGRPLSIKERIAAMKLENGKKAEPKPETFVRKYSSKQSKVAKGEDEKERESEGSRASISNDAASESKVSAMLGIGLKDSSAASDGGAEIINDGVDDRKDEDENDDGDEDEDGNDDERISSMKRMSQKLGIKADTKAERRMTIESVYPLKKGGGSSKFQVRSILLFPNGVTPQLTPFVARSRRIQLRDDICQNLVVEVGSLRL